MLTLKRVNLIMEFLVKNNHCKNTNIFYDEILVKEDKDNILIEEVCPCDKDTCRFSENNHVVASTEISKNIGIESFYQTIFMILDGDYFDFKTQRRFIKINGRLKNKHNRKVNKI